MQIATADVFIRDEDIFLHCDDNELYNITDMLNFNHIVIADAFVQFNGTGFYNSNPVNATMLFLRHSLMSFGNNHTLLSYNISESSFKIFNISGFSPNRVYQIYTNDTFMENITADADGYVNFTVDINDGNVKITFTNWFKTIATKRPIALFLSIGCLFAVCFGLLYFVIKRKKKKRTIINWEAKT